MNVRDTRYFEPSLEDNDLVSIGDETLDRAEQLISGCEHCTEEAEMSLDYILDALTDCDPTSTEYVLCRPARCPQCRQDVTEKTLIVTQKIWS